MTKTDFKDFNELRIYLRSEVSNLRRSESSAKTQKAKAEFRNIARGYEQILELLGDLMQLGYILVPPPASEKVDDNEFDLDEEFTIDKATDDEIVAHFRALAMESIADPVSNRVALAYFYASEVVDSREKPFFQAISR